MSVGILSEYIDDLLKAEDEDIRHYLQRAPGAERDLRALLLAARAAHEAIQAIQADPARAQESRDRAHQELAAVLAQSGPHRPGGWRRLFRRED